MIKFRALAALAAAAAVSLTACGTHAASRHSR
jgi:predicted small secreted protein